MVAKSISSCLQHIAGYQEQAPLAPFSTFKIGGPARYLVQPTSTKEVQEVALCIIKNNIPYTIIGGGSNILVSDEGFDGIVVIPRLTEIQFKENLVIAGSGVPLQKVIMECAKQELSGLEHLVGIPGSLGGATAGNAGTSSQWLDQHIETVEAVDFTTGEMKQFSKQECAFGYRTSIFKNSLTYVITQTELTLKKDNPIAIKKRMADYISRRNKQPAGNACAGCVFKNPLDTPAGKIIDELGLKGKKIGNAQVSFDHGNFIVNLGGATAKEIIMLISYLKQQVRDKRGIQLQEEIRYIGF